MPSVTTGNAAHGEDSVLSTPRETHTMSQFDHADPKPLASQSTGCFLGLSTALLAGIVLVAAASVLAFVFLPRLLQGPLDLEQGGAVGKRLPELELRPLTGATEPVTLDLLAGKVVVLNFWGTWCGPCRLELPHIVHLDETFGSRADFKLLAVSCSPPGGNQSFEELRDETEAVLLHSGFNMPTYADEGAVTRKAYNSIEPFRGYPTTMLIDREGVIRRVWIGFDPRMTEQMEPLIEELLGDG